MHEEHRTGIEYIDAVTALTQRQRGAHPTAGVYEAADFQWSWRKPRSTDVQPQLFWFDDEGRPEAAAIVTDWGDGFGLDPIALPGASRDWISHVIEKGIAHARESGFDEFDFVIDRADTVMLDVLAAHGFTQLADELVDSWLRADARPSISPLHPDYRLATRRDTSPAPHHLIARNGPAVEERLGQTSLYRPDLDLVVLDADDGPVASGLFWFDPVSATGLVEPMRTEDDHQGRGLARHVLTSGLNLLFDAGAARVKIAWDPENGPARTVYTSVGFAPDRECVLVSRPTSTARRY